MILILSDGKSGHLNQSLAFAKLKNIKYEIVEIYTNPFSKILSYILDFSRIYINLFGIEKRDYKKYKAVVSAGSGTYYANKYLAKKYNLKSVAIMLPKGFRYDDFNYIIAQNHDNPPNKENIISIPVNLSTNQPKGLVKKEDKKALAIIIGGNNSTFSIKRELIKKELDNIFKNYPDYLKYVTTSRRTPKEIEELLKEYAFDYKIIYSKDPNINPIPDFLEVCDILFITVDSTSMLSEARANSKAEIKIIKLDSKKYDTKFHRLAEEIEKIDEKFDYDDYLKKVEI